MTQYLKFVYAGREGPSNTRKMEAGRERGRREWWGQREGRKGGRGSEGGRHGMILWLTYSTVHHLQCTILDLNTRQWFVSARVAHL